MHSHVALRLDCRAATDACLGVLGNHAYIDPSAYTYVAADGQAATDTGVLGAIGRPYHHALVDTLVSGALVDARVLGNECFGALVEDRDRRRPGDGRPRGGRTADGHRGRVFEGRRADREAFNDAGLRHAVGILDAIRRSHPGTVAFGIHHRALADVGLDVVLGDLRRHTCAYGVLPQRHTAGDRGHDEIIGSRDQYAALRLDRARARNVRVDVVRNDIDGYSAAQRELIRRGTADSHADEMRLNFLRKHDRLAAHRYRGGRRVGRGPVTSID